MTTFPRLAAEWEAFVALPREQLIASVLRILDGIYDDTRVFDFDRLMSTGIRLAQSSVPVADFAQAIIDWAHAVPDEKRLGMAAALLNGLWKNRRGAPLVFEEDLESYLALIEAIAIEDEADNVRQTLDVIQPGLRGPLLARLHEVKLQLGPDAPR